MELPLTSLVPTVVELVSFIERNWPHVWWLPNWYLGVPLRFVTGPVVPLLVVLLRKILPASIESLYLGLIGIAWLMGGLGAMLLTRELGGSRRAQRLTGVFFLLLPSHLWLLSFGSGLHHLVVSLLPWIVIVGQRALLTERRIPVGVTILVIAATLLIDVGSILPILVSMIVVVVMNRFIRNWGVLIVRSLLMLFAALSLATVWYTPRFWWVLLGNPSFGGKPLSNVIPFVLQLVQALVPLAFGVWVVQKRYRLTNKVIQFGILFGASFGFLTVIRFLSDVDFWMDWTGYFLELQLVIAILGGVVMNRYIKRWYITLFIISMLTIASGVSLFKLYKTDEKNTLYKERITKTMTEYVQPDKAFDTEQNRGAQDKPFVRQLVDQSGRVFLSGSPVFWLGAVYSRVLSSAFPQKAPQGNPFLGDPLRSPPAESSVISNGVRNLGSKAAVNFDDSRSFRSNNLGLMQVRGGRDEVSTHKTWAMGAYNIREGDPSASFKVNVELMKNWLTAFGVSHLLVHQKNSMEYYKDFKNIERFTVLEEVTRDKGDVLYRVPASLARLADRTILSLPSPTEGSDETTLASYVETLGEPVDMTYAAPTQIEIELPQPFPPDQVVSLAVTFDRRWQARESGVRLAPDALGNIVVIPTGEVSQMTLEYKETWFDTWSGVGISGLCIFLLIKSERVTAWIKQKVPSITTSEDDEEQQY